MGRGAPCRREDRPWSRFLNRDRFDTFRVATYLKVGKFDEAQQLADGLLARLSPAEGKRAAVIRENIAAAHLARGSVTEAARVAQSGLAIVRETEFATTWKPKSHDWKPSALPAGITRPNAVLTSGSCATRGATNSASCNRSSPTSWPGESPGITDPCPADQ